MADTVYQPTRKFCNNFLRRMGIEITYYDPLIGSEIETLMKKNTRCLFMESPGSLTFEVQDIPALVDVAKKNSIITIVDNTWATPYFFQPLTHGVNVSVTSATKYIIGHSDAMLGLIVSDKENYKAIRSCRTTLGQRISPDDAYLAIRGMKTLGTRLEKHESNAYELAIWLQNQPGVIKVLHPAIDNNPGHKLWKRDFNGSSSLFSFEVTQHGRTALASFLDRLELFSIGLSWGGCESLIVPVEPKTTRSATTWNSNGQLIRIHVGLEDIQDIKNDVAKGLDRYFGRSM